MLEQWLSISQKMFKLNQSWEKTWKVSSKLCFQFSNLSADYNPMHTDKNFAKSYGFKDKIVHGNILQLFLSYFVGEMLPKKNVVIISQKIKYLKPIYVNQHITLKSKLENLNWTMGLLEFRIVFNTRCERIAEGKLDVKIL